MLILPDRNVVRTRCLMPVSEKEWREPSQAVPRDSVGNPVVQTRFRLKAKTHDGVEVWKGWFDDRNDFDAFLTAISLQTLNQERALWDLPTPMWPGLDPGLVYYADTVTFLTSTSVQVYNRPADWRDNANLIEAVGGGANTYASGGDASSAGGGGGAYAAINNHTLSATSNYRCGLNGGTYGSGSNTVNTYFKTTATLLAAGGQTVTSYPTGGLGGTTTNSVGSPKYKGGDGGDYGGTNSGGGGGGGAAGPNGAGVDGDNNVPGSYVGQAGGDGDAGFGGAGGATAAQNTDGNPGSPGTEWDASHGCGGGGGAAGQSTTQTGGAGGAYGGGGGGGSSGVLNGGSGLIVITYTPIRFNSLSLVCLYN